MGKFYSIFIILKRKLYLVLVPIENNAISRSVRDKDRRTPLNFFYVRLVQFCCRSTDFMNLCINNMQPASGFDWSDGLMVVE